MQASQDWPRDEVKLAVVGRGSSYRALAGAAGRTAMDVEMLREGADFEDEVGTRSGGSAQGRDGDGEGSEHRAERRIGCSRRQRSCGGW